MISREAKPSSSSTKSAQERLEAVLTPQSVDYASQRPRLLAARDELKATLSSLVAAQRLECRIEARLKEWDQIVPKIEDGRVEYWSSCPDLLAAQIIVLSSDLVDDALAAIRNLRRPDSQSRRYWHSSTGRSRGYAAVHLQIELPLALDVPDPVRATGAELQVLTVLQAAWVTVTHDQFYKPKAGVPLQVRNRVHRLAAAADLLDQEITSITTTLDTLRRELHEEFKARANEDTWGTMLLDEVTLEAATADNGPLASQFDSLRDMASTAGFQSSAWTTRIRVGLETDVFLSFAEMVGINQLDDLHSYISRTRRWRGAFKELVAALGGRKNPLLPLFDRPLFVLTLVLAFEHPGSPGPNIRTDVLSAVRDVRARFDNSGRRRPTDRV